MSNYELNKAWTEGYDQGVTDGMATSEAAYTRGFSMGFWAAVLLVSAAVCAGFLMMRIA